MTEDTRFILEKLSELGIEYTLLEHEECATMDDLKAYEEQIGAPHCKDLFLQDRQGREFFLLLLVGNKKFRTAEVSKEIGRARLSFGNAEKLEEYLHETGGAINPLGLLFDTNHNVILLIDEDLNKLDEICFHPNDSRYSLKMKYLDFINVFLPHLGIKPTYITVSSYL